MVIKEAVIEELIFRVKENTPLLHYIATDSEGQEIHVYYTYYHRQWGWLVCKNGHIYGYRNELKRAFKLANKVSSLEDKCS